MNEKILNIKQVIIKLGKSKTILLGNGFSMAYDYNRFSFTNLLKTAIDQQIIPSNSNLLNLFHDLDTADFEKVIKYLDQSVSVMKTYNVGANILKSVENDAKQLKKHLINTVMNNHPESVSDFDKEKSKICSKFLNIFDRIYTLNYDLLGYWVIMQNNLKSKFSDGFANEEKIGYDFGSVNDSDYVEYKGLDHKLFFIHGGLHIFDKKTKTIKLCWERHKNKTNLKKQIYQNILKDVYPVFVTEGTWEEKKEKIIHSEYLNKCYKSFSAIGGDLVIFGTVLKSNDDHIAHKIVNGKLKNIFIGCYNKEDIKNASLIADRVNEWNKDTNNAKKEVHLFSTEKFNPWLDGIE